MEKLVIKKFNGITHKLTDERIVEYFGKKYKSSYWLECDAEGNIIDSSGDGIISNKSLLCKIPEGNSDLDLSTLNDDCLN